jgi:transcriptional regulator with XRE-family HTH domain
MEVREFLDTFHRRLKKLREERGLTVKEAAKLVSVPMTTYRDWEYGRAVTGQPYVKIAKAFGVSLNWLLGFDEEIHTNLEEKIDRVITDLRQIKAEISKSRKNS